MAGRWREAMDAKVEILEGRQHFNEPRMPELLELLMMLGAWVTPHLPASAQIAFKPDQGRCQKRLQPEMQGRRTRL